MRHLLFPCLVAVASCTAPGAGEADGPLLIAHRGNSSEAPENTLAAMRSALALGAPPELVEIDVHTSRDGELVVIHDATLERTTDGQGAVAEKSWDEIRGLDAGFADRFGLRFTGERVPSLDEVLDAVAGTGTGVMIEVKVHGAGGSAARLVVQRGEMDRHLIASFEPDVVVDASLEHPGIRTMLISGRATDEVVELASRIGASVLGVDHGGLTPQIVEQAHSKELELWCWTVDDEERAAELLRWGVDGIITNRPAAMRSLAALRR
ncbi:MAG: glycerophosphodiester phosphodiesterase family protein [Planctomycetota bacterium]|nr:glycerophosphodiester phosphodiesterase family protein [Planctomycetota bacterium]